MGLDPIPRGSADYPRQSELLGQLSQDIDQAAQARARKFNWRIQPAGDTALNLLGLSTQVPALKALGKEHIDAAVVEKLRQWLDPKLRARLLRDTRMVTSWIAS